MRLTGTTGFPDAPVEYSALHCARNGEKCVMVTRIQEEWELDVYIDDEVIFRIACTNNHLDEMVTGLLCTEGIVESTDEIEELSMRETPLSAIVRLKEDGSLKRQRVPRRSEESVPAKVGSLHPVDPIVWDTDWVLKMIDEFSKDRTSHASTGGTHSVFLSVPERILCMREDIGRHNAFDKAVGWALANDVDLSKCMLFTSGRIPFDMIVKATRAKIPILVTKAVATDKAIMAARNLGITLISRALPDGFDVLSDPLNCSGALIA